MKKWILSLLTVVSIFGAFTGVAGAEEVKKPKEPVVHLMDEGSGW